MIQPLNTYVLVEHKEAEQKTESGLYVPPTANDNALGFLREGLVKAVNPKCESIKVGNTVLYNKHAVANIPNSKELKLVREEDIYAVMH